MTLPKISLLFQINLLFADVDLPAVVLKQIRELTGKGQMLDVSLLSLIDVNSFYGIEYEEFPAEIARVALWLTDHQANMELSAEFGLSFVRL